MIRRFQLIIALLTCSSLICTSSAASLDIGIVMTSGRVVIDGNEVPGTSAIFSGNEISSGAVNSTLQFRDGTSAVMRPSTVVVVYGDRSDLRRGIAQQSGVDRHSVLADGFTISSKASNAVVLVGVKDDSHFEVAPRIGEAEVLSPSGTLIARIEQGNILSFDIAQAPEASTKPGKLCGDLKDNYQLTDVLTSVTYQLQGADLAKYVGHSIRVTGTVSPDLSSPQVFVVSGVTKLNRPCVNGPGAQSSVTNAAGGKKIAALIIIAAGGTILGLGLAGAFGGPAPVPATPAVP